MKSIRYCGLLIAVLVLSAMDAEAQPLPVEVMLGNKYGIINFSFARNFSQNSKLGFFHMNTVQFDYKNQDNSFILQDLLYVEALKNLRIAGGVAYSPGGFNPTAGIQYVYGGKKLFFLFAPRVNIESDPSIDIMTIMQYKQALGDRIKLYCRLQFLNLFDKAGNIKSYQWIRLGVDIKGLQMGPALNLDEYGPSPSVQSSFGIFVRKEIF